MAEHDTGPAAPEEEPQAPAPAAEGAEAETEAPEALVEEDLDELSVALKERDEYLALAQRAQADFENYRKRVAREQSGAETRGVAKLARELLPALDNLDLAIASAEAQEGDDEHHLTKGIRLVQQELVAALGRVGLEAFSPKGEPFDPNEHEAMSKQAVEGVPSGTVADVYAQGYRLNGTVLRPARVVVAE